MASHHPGAAPAPDPYLVPPILATWLAVFRPCFTAPVWNRVLVLVAGAVLAPGKRTVTQILRVMGLADDRHCSATITVSGVLPHPGMLPSRYPIASPECSRSIVGLPDASTL